MDSVDGLEFIEEVLPLLGKIMDLVNKENICYFVAIGCFASLLLQAEDILSIFVCSEKQLPSLKLWICSIRYWLSWRNCKVWSNGLPRIREIIQDTPNSRVASRKPLSLKISKSIISDSFIR